MHGYTSIQDGILCDSHTLIFLSFRTKLKKMLDITGKLFNVIKSMYDQIKSCVRFDDELSNFYRCHKGLVQGEALSPLELDIIQNCHSIQINQINLFLLMYADDTILIAETSEHLQEMMDTLQTWTNEYGLTVNINKTKIIVLRSSWQLGNETFFYNGEQVEIVNTFSYLGLYLHYNGKFNVTQKHIAAQGKKSLFCLMKEVQKHNFNIVTLLSLFDTYMSPILNYCFEIWGYIKAQEIEKVHTMFLKRLLGVKRSTSNDMVYREMGRLPLIVQRKYQILKYWTKLIETENCILRAVYDMTWTSCVENDIQNWLSEIREILIDIGMAEVWQQQRIDNEKLFLYVAKQSLKDLAYQKIDRFINDSNKCIFYKHVYNCNILFQPYLNVGVLQKYKKIIAKFRLSAHAL